MIRHKTSKDKTPSYKWRVFKLWSSQLLILLFMFLCAWILQSKFHTDNKSSLTLSVLVGGMVYWIPNAYFTLYAFQFRGAQATELILRSMYKGEFGKLMLTAAGFAIIFAFLSSIHPVAVFSVFTVMMFSQFYLVSRWS